MTINPRFSLRVLLVLMLLFGCLLVPVVQRLNEAQEQKAAVERVLRAGGSAHYDYEHDKNGNLLKSATPRGPELLRRVLGEDFFCHVQHVVCRTYLPGDSDVGLLSDSDMQTLTKLKHIRRLTISTYRLTNTGLENLRKMTTLESLVLVNAENVTNRQLEHIKALVALKRLTVDCAAITDIDCLKDLKNLKELQLTRSDVTNAGLRCISEFALLQHLALNDTYITDSGLEHVGKLKDLRTLYLDDTRVRDEGLKHINTLLNLRTLSLKETSISDGGLEHIKRLKNLEVLSLDRTLVTDAGLEHLVELKNLRELNLMGTHVTQAGRAKLQKALPNCKL